MKNAAKYAEGLKQLHKRLLRDGKPNPRQAIEPLDALVRAAMTYDVSDNRAEDAARAIGREFVDLNELRVATDLEIQEMLGVRYPAIEQRVAMITQSLNDIFEREGFMENIMEYARQFTPPNKAAKAVGRIKRAVQTGWEIPMESALAVERENQQILFQSEDAKEGLAAYVEKRPAVFTAK